MRVSAPTQCGGGQGGVGESLRTLFEVGTLSGLTDSQLLDRFAKGRGDGAESEACFAALVERHGTMVLRVCQAVLGDRHDAEDACQATFLVLAQAAGQIRRGDSVASWLYGVARRVSLRARRQAARRREHERRRLEGINAAQPVCASRGTLARAVRGARPAACDVLRGGHSLRPGRAHLRAGRGVFTRP